MRLGRVILEGAVWAAIVLSIVPDSSRAQTVATCEPGVGAPGEPFNHSEKGELNSRVTVQAIMLRDTPTGRTRGFVLVERGKERWQGNVRRNQGSDRVSPSGRDVTGTTSVMFGGPLISYALGPDSAVVRFMGKSYPLADGNVLLIDRVDEKDEATVQVAGCIALTDAEAKAFAAGEGTVIQMILRIPAVAAFVGPSWRQR